MPSHSVSPGSLLRSLSMDFCSLLFSPLWAAFYFCCLCVPSAHCLLFSWHCSLSCAKWLLFPLWEMSLKNTVPLHQRVKWRWAGLTGRTWKICLLIWWKWLVLGIHISEQVDIFSNNDDDFLKEQGFWMAPMLHPPVILGFLLAWLCRSPSWLAVGVPHLAFQSWFLLLASLPSLRLCTSSVIAHFLPFMLSIAQFPKDSSGTAQPGASGANGPSAIRRAQIPPCAFHWDLPVAPAPSTPLLLTMVMPHWCATHRCRSFCSKHWIYM